MRDAQSNKTSVVLLLVGMVAMITGCSRSDSPIAVSFWVWSDGERGRAVEALVDRFNAHQDRVVVTTSTWPERSERGAELLATLEASEEGATTPALVEVPDAALPALIEAEKARDVSGRFAKRLGVVYDDFFPWLLPAERFRSEGVQALPLFREAPLIATAEGSPVAAALAAGGLPALLEATSMAEASPPQPPPRPLSAPADARLMLALLRQTEALEVDDDGETTLDQDRAAEAFRLWRALLPEGPRPATPAGEAAAVTDLVQGRARAAWLWSPSLSSLPTEGYSVTRAPVRSRGTWLVVYGGAGWRERQGAFRLERWMTEPMQATALAERFWTIPVRRSAAMSARYRSASGPRAWRRAVTDPEDPLVLPPRVEVTDTLLGGLETAFVNESRLDGWIERLQRALTASDEEEHR